VVFDLVSGREIARVEEVADTPDPTEMFWQDNDHLVAYLGDEPWDFSSLTVFDTMLHPTGVIGEAYLHAPVATGTAAYALEGHRVIRVADGSLEVQFDVELGRADTLLALDPTGEITSAPPPPPERPPSVPGTPSPPVAAPPSPGAPADGGIPWGWIGLGAVLALGAAAGAVGWRRRERSV
jgi:hypothetical protein